MLALCLLFAQAFAQAHVYSHLKADPHGSDLGGSVVRVCGDCLATAPLLSVVGAPEAPRVVISASAPPPAPTVAPSSVDAYPYLAFRSRAPPELL